MKSITLAITLVLLSTAFAETWTDTRGRSIEADLVRHDFDADQIEFALPSGRKIRMKISTLSEASQARLKVIEAENMAKFEKLVPGEEISFTPAGELAKFTYHCYVPTSYKPDKRTPILLAFSASGKGKAIMANFKEAAEAKGWLVVGFDNLKNKMTWSDAERDKAHKLLLADVAKNIPHHPFRMYLGGMSGGGLRSFQIAMAHSELPIAGIISCGGWLGRDYAGQKITTYMAVAIVNGDKDEAANSHVTRNTAFLKGFHARVKPFTFKGGHTLPPKNITMDIFTWLEADWAATGMKEQVKKMRARK